MSDMERYLMILLAVSMLAACQTKMEQPDPGTGLGEIYLTAPAGAMSVSVDLDGLWRVWAEEDWISLDINGRDGRGAFTFSYSSNESDFSVSRGTRLGHVIVQSIPQMRSDTLYIRQQGIPDGKDYYTRLSGSYIGIPDTGLERVDAIYMNAEGLDLSYVSAMASEVDLAAVICTDDMMASSLAASWQGQSAVSGHLLFLSPQEEMTSVSSVSDPASLTVSFKGVNYVLADFSEEDADRLAQLRSLLDSGYNVPGASSRWVIGGSFYYCSVMETGYPDTPAWFPSSPKDEAFEADLYAWDNNLVDCIWMVSRGWTPTYSDEKGDWRADYVYASGSVWNYMTAVSLMEKDASMSHTPVRFTLKY